MGTSNWQNIPYCVEILRAIDPHFVLDVGVGFGRWGMILREFCDVWSGRVHQNQWELYIEGIEAFPKNIENYHNSFYNRIHIGDIRDVILDIRSDWDVIIFGDVLEHFEREEGSKLLETSLSISSYVLVNVPLGPEWDQDEAYGNVYEKHLSEWNISDFSSVSRSIFEDYIGRPFGSFILSNSDPKSIRCGF